MMRALPSLAVEVMPVMPSTPLSMDSIGSTTCFSTTSGEAPWYGASTDTIGNSMEGSSCCLSCGMAMAPKRSATIDTRPTKALWARLKRDSHDMGMRSLCSDEREGTPTLSHPGSAFRRSQVPSLCAAYRVWSTPYRAVLLRAWAYQS